MKNNLKNNLKNKKKKGFTLIELIIVIAIIAIIAAIAIPKFGEVRKDAAFKSDIANAKTIANAATTLLADGKLGSTTTFDIDNEITPGNPIEEYLQNPPKPKVNGYDKYVVTISGETVTVTMSGNSNEVPLFPVAATTAP